MVVLKKSANVGLAAFLIIFTAIVKIRYFNFCLYYPFCRCIHSMTRMCRAQFELDNITEADIICRRRFRQPSSEGLHDSVAGSNIRNAKGILDQLVSKSSTLTRRLPAWVNLSYLMPRGGRQPQHQHLDSFRLQQDKDLPLALSQPGEVRVSEPLSPQEGPSNVTKCAPDDGRSRNVSSPAEKRGSGVLNINLDRVNDSDTVTPHPPPAPWDDQAVIDLPYDNPFYTRTIDNVLWLPRNPASALDLDDTVDMKTSITVEVSAGRLGTWLGLGETTSPTALSPIITSTPFPPEQVATPSVIPHTLGLPEVDGTENIDLPPIIAQRVQAKEGGVEQALRTRKSSGIYSRRPSTADKSSINTMSFRMQHPQAPERPILPYYRSFSDNADNRPRSSSLVSTLQLPPSDTVERVCSDQEHGNRPDAHAQAEFMAATGSASRTSLGPPKLSRPPNVSAAHAIFHEVVQEERQALWDRLEEETAEAKHSQSTKSWLTSWMFRKSS